MTSFSKWNWMPTVRVSARRGRPPPWRDHGRAVGQTSAATCSRCQSTSPPGRYISHNLPRRWDRFLESLKRRHGI